jgi:hypothetical protein
MSMDCDHSCCGLQGTLMVHLKLKLHLLRYAYSNSIYIYVLIVSIYK